MVGLIFPSALNQSAREAARKILVSLSAEDAQALLDELSGRLAVGGVRSSPIAYLRSLINRQKNGDFVPELAHGVAEQRQKRIQESSSSCRSAEPKKSSPEVGSAHLAEIKQALKCGGRS